MNREEVVYEDKKIDPTNHGKVKEKMESSADRMEKLFREELLPFMKKMTEIQSIENALKDARIAGDEKLAQGLSNALLEKLSK